LRVIGAFTLLSSTVTNNISATTTDSSYAVGGGIQAQSDDLTIIRSSISDNSGVGANEYGNSIGGGITIMSDQIAMARIEYSLLARNSAYRGGGISAGYGPLDIVASTISANVASGLGGGVFIRGGGPYYGSPLTLISSTVTLNVSNGSRGGAGIVDSHNPQLGLTSFQSSIIAGNGNTAMGASYAADVASTYEDASLLGANNLIIAASGVTLPADTISADPVLGPLQDNGGVTWTHALLPGSPAIDAGNNSADLDFDQRGEGYPRFSGLSADIGAFELQQAPIDMIFADGFDGS
jgi:hypothetical protein